MANLKNGAMARADLSGSDSHSGRVKIREAISKALGKQALFLISSENFSETIQALVKIITNELKRELTYLSTHDSYRFLADYFNEELIDINKMAFIDCVSTSIGIEKVNEKIILVNSPADLKHLQLAAEKMARTLKGANNFFILDSIEGLAVNSSENDSAEFLNVVMAQMRTNKITGIYFAIKEERGSRMIQSLIKKFDITMEI